MTTKTRLFAATALATVAAVAAPAVVPPAAAVEVGKTAAVNPQAVGIPPQQQQRVLHVGTDIIADERVQTTERGRAQLLFLDGSALSVGPNSDIVIDRFVYDPEKSAGDLAFSATKGIFRLVGGRISKNKEVTFKTPTATIGIRGGIGLIRVDDSGSTRATFLFGEKMTVTSNATGVTTSTNRPASVDVPPESDPSPPQPPNDAELEEALDKLQKDEDEEQVAFDDTTAEDAGGETDGDDAAAADSAADDAGDDTGGDDGGDGDTVAAEEDGTTTDIDAALEDSGLDVSGETVSGDTTVTTTTTTTSTETFTTTEETEVVETIEDITTDNTTNSTNTTSLTLSGSAWIKRLMPIDVAQWDPESWRAPMVTANNQAVTIESKDGIAVFTLKETGETFQLPLKPGAYTFDAADTDYDDKNLLTSNTAEKDKLVGWAHVEQDGSFYMFASPGVGRYDPATGETTVDVPGFALYGGQTTPAANFPTSGVSAYQMKAPSGVPFLPFGPAEENIQQEPGITISPLYVRHDDTMMIGDMTTDDSRAVHLQGTIAILGTGASQVSFALVELGNIVVEDATGKPALTGMVLGSLREQNGQDVLEGYISTARMENDTAIFGNAAEHLVFAADYVGPNTAGDAIVRESAALAREQWDPETEQWVVDPVYAIDHAVKTTAPNLTWNGGTKNLKGYAAGFGIRSEIYQDGEYTWPGAFSTGPTPEGVNIYLDDTSGRAMAVFAGQQFTPPGGTPEHAATFVFGSLTGLGENGSSAHIGWLDGNPLFAARIEEGSTSSFKVVWEYVRGADYGVGAMVSNAVAPVSGSGGLVPTDAQGNAKFELCKCEYLTWGWWAGAVGSEYEPVTKYDPVEEEVAFHLSTWVAGELPDTSKFDMLAQNGVTATYQGHVIADVRINDPAAYPDPVYIASGKFTHTWDFAAGQGNVTINHFDEANIGAVTMTGSAATTGGANFSGNFTGGGFSGSYDGSFFGATDGTTAPGGMGGRIAIHDGYYYEAIGTFAADKVADGIAE